MDWISHYFLLYKDYLKGVRVKIKMYNYSLSQIFSQLRNKHILTRYVFDCAENEKIQMMIKNAPDLTNGYIFPRVTEETIQELIFDGSAIITFDIRADTVDSQRMNYFIARRIFIKAGYHIRENPHDSLCVVVSRESIPFEWPPNDLHRTFSLPAEEDDCTDINDEQKVEKIPTKVDKRIKKRVKPEDFRSYLLKFNKPFLVNQLVLNSIKVPEKKTKIKLINTLCDFYADNVKKGIKVILPKR